MKFPTLTIVTAIVLLLTYAGIALERIPGFRLDRAGIALSGAALMMAIGAIAPEEAYRAVNLDTLAQPHRRRARPRCRHPRLVMGVLPSRNSDHLGHTRFGRLVVELIGGAAGVP